MGILLFPLTAAFIVIRLAIVLVCIVALLDCIRRPERAFAMMGKQTKQIWLAITAAAALFALLGFFAFISLIAAIVYLVDVRPSVRQVSGDGPERHSGPYGPW